jgi:hypothetical protein
VFSILDVSSFLNQVEHRNDKNDPQAVQNFTFPLPAVV